MIARDEMPQQVSRETRARLEAFAALHKKWSRTINLTAASTNNDVWRRHIADSAQILDLAPDALYWADLGSGGGFPGMVIAIILEGKSGAKVELIESNRKKTAFLHAVKTECAPSAIIHSARAEQVITQQNQPEIVTARALAPLTELLNMTRPWLSGATRALFHKGRGYAAEVEESHAKWHYDLVVHESRVDTDSVILDITNLMDQPAL